MGLGLVRVEARSSATGAPKLLPNKGIDVQEVGDCL